ncbi:Uncharacterised protein [Mycobacteroides abscessus subsp. abscessus]|nr:Uncharacterised protein [Mycobacteroides abscessus subsp. abscessus]
MHSVTRGGVVIGVELGNGAVGLGESVHLEQWPSESGQRALE